MIDYRQFRDPRYRYEDYVGAVDIAVEDDGATDGPFLRQTLWGWIERAAALRGRALAVGLMHRRLCDMRRGQATAASQDDLERLGVGRKAYYRALELLEAEDLLVVRRRPGARPLVAVPPARGSRDAASGAQQRRRKR